MSCYVSPVAVSCGGAGRASAAILNSGRQPAAQVTGGIRRGVITLLSPMAGRAAQAERKAVHRADADARPVEGQPSRLDRGTAMK